MDFHHLIKNPIRVFREGLHFYCENRHQPTLPLLQDAHRRWEKLIKATGYGSAHKLLNFDRSALALDAAIGGHGIAIAPTYMIENDLSSKRLVEIWVDPESSSDGLYVSWSKDHVGQQRMSRIVDWIAAEFE